VIVAVLSVEDGVCLHVRVLLEEVSKVAQAVVVFHLVLCRAKRVGIGVRVVVETSLSLFGCA